MAYELAVKIATKSACYNDPRKMQGPLGAMLHSVGCSQPSAENWANRWNSPTATVCATYVIEPSYVIQVLPENKRPWTSGSGANGNANTLGYIQFEICEDDTKNKDYAMAVYKEAVEFSAYILKMFNLDPHGKNRWNLPVTLDHAAGHQLGIASNHGDVLHWFGKYGITLAKIKQDIAKEMGQTPTPEPEPGKVPYKLKLTKGTPYYEKPDNKSKVNGKVEATTNYTIVEESGIYGKLKSGDKLEVKRNCQRIEPDQSCYIVTFSECKENGVVYEQ